MIFARMYVQKGCPHCENAKLYLLLNNVEHEVIEVGTDPIISQGLIALFNSVGKPVQVPVTISLVTSEVIVGSEPQHLRIIVDSARRFGAISPDAPITLGGSVQVAAG